jgi:hypothetical protein
MSESAPLKYARGTRPQFFDDPSVDALLVAVLELAQDVSVLRDRLDAYEHFLEAQDVATRTAFEAHQLPADIQSAQAARRKDFIERLLRAVEKL